MENYVDMFCYEDSFYRRILLNKKETKKNFQTSSLYHVKIFLIKNLS